MYILSPMFTILFCVFFMPDSCIFEPTFLYAKIPRLQSRG